MGNSLPVSDSKLLRRLKTAVRGFMIGGGAVLLVVWLALFGSPLNNASAETKTIGDYTIETSTTDPTCTITGYSGSATDITIPKSFLSDGTTYIVTAIEGTVSGYNYNGICTSLTSVTFEEPSSITSIGNYAFYYCHNLTSITLPASVTSIGEYAFFSDERLASVTIPNSVQTIGTSAFGWCTSLTSVAFAETSIITSIGDNAFYNTGLASVTIPNSVQTIEANAFDSCSSLTSVTFEETSIVKSIGNSAFQKTGLTSISIPNSVETIGANAFRECNNLASLTLGTKIQTIGAEAFHKCDNLVSIDVDSGNEYYSSDSGVLFNKNKSELIACPGAKTTCSIPATVASISNYAFSYSTKLTSVTFAAPSSITSIGREVFINCTGLTSITIPASVTTIGNSAFSGSGLTSITIPDSVTEIGEYAFDCCRSLANVTLGNKLVTIGNGAFYGTSLTSVTIPDSVTTIGDNAFSEYQDFDDKPSSSLTSVTFGNSIKTIGEYAFTGTHLTSITIPASVTSIGTEAFGKGYWGDGSSSLVAAYFCGNKPATIGTELFKDAASGFTVYIPKGDTTYDTWSDYTTQEYSNGLVFYKGAQWKVDGTIRLIATIDSLDPYAVGFVYSTTDDTPTIGEGATQLSTTTVYTSIIANGTTKNAASLGGTYIVAIPVSGITESIYVRTFATKDGKTEYGGVFTVTPANLP